MAGSMQMPGVLFDMDGVLVDSGPMHREAWGLLAAEVGRELTPAFFDETFGMRNDDILARLLGPGLEAARAARLGERKETLYRSLAAGRLVPAPGALVLAEALRAAGWRQAVASSGPRQNVELMLGTTGLGAWIDAWVSAEDVRRAKPHPEVFLAAASRLGLAPEACVVIEDAPVGIEAGLAAGMAVVALAPTHTPARLDPVHRVLSSLAELDPARLAGLLGRGGGGKRPGG